MDEHQHDTVETIANYESQWPLLVHLARKEVEQTRKNLDRELAEWKSKSAKLSARVGKLRRVNRQLKSGLSLDTIKAAYRRARLEKIIGTAVPSASPANEIATPGGA